MFGRSAKFYEFEDRDYVWLSHPMRQQPDRVAIAGGRAITAVNISNGTPPGENVSNGEWYYSNRSKELTYIVSGKGSAGLADRGIDLKVA